MQNTTLAEKSVGFGFDQNQALIASREPNDLSYIKITAPGLFEPAELAVAPKGVVRPLRVAPDAKMRKTHRPSSGNRYKPVAATDTI